LQAVQGVADLLGVELALGLVDAFGEGREEGAQFGAVGGHAGETVEGVGDALAGEVHVRHEDAAGEGRQQRPHLPRERERRRREVGEVGHST